MNGGGCHICPVRPGNGPAPVTLRLRRIAASRKKNLSRPRMRVPFAQNFTIPATGTGTKRPSDARRRTEFHKNDISYPLAERLRLCHLGRDASVTEAKCHRKDDDMRYIVTAMLSAAAMAAIPLTAIAQDEDPIHQAIEARKGFYQMLAINMGQLAGMAKGDIAYDEAAASRAAANIEALTQYDLPSLFIEGSGRGQTSEETAAKPDIWTNMDDFRAKFAGLAEAATGASEAVKGGADKVGAVVGKIGAACKACHDSYREKS